MVCRSDESRHLLLPFPVLRFLRLIRSLRSLQTLRTIRSIRSIRETRVQKQNESRLDEVIHEHTWRGKRKERAEKTNNFERFFGDLTLTFLTFGNTFRLPILPTRRLVLLRGRERKI